MTLTLIALSFVCIAIIFLGFTLVGDGEPVGLVPIVIGIFLLLGIHGQVKDNLEAKKEHVAYVQMRSDFTALGTQYAQLKKAHESSAALLAAAKGRLEVTSSDLNKTRAQLEAAKTAIVKANDQASKVKAEAAIASEQLTQCTRTAEAYKFGYERAEGKLESIKGILETK